MVGGGEPGVAVCDGGVAQFAHGGGGVSAAGVAAGGAIVGVLQTALMGCGGLPGGGRGTARRGSIGLTFPDTAVRLVAPENGEDVPAGGRGAHPSRYPPRFPRTTREGQGAAAHAA